MYYCPEIGRMLSRDLVPRPQGDRPTDLNGYVYCSNDPANRIDPDGNDDAKVEVKEIDDETKINKDPGTGKPSSGETTYKGTIKVTVKCDNGVWKVVSVKSELKITVNALSDAVLKKLGRTVTNKEVQEYERDNNAKNFKDAWDTTYKNHETAMKKLSDQNFAERKFLVNALDAEKEKLISDFVDKALPKINQDLKNRKLPPQNADEYKTLAGLDVELEVEDEKK